MNTPLSKADSKIIIYSINWLQLLCGCLQSIENPLLSHSRQSWETPPHVPQLELSCSSPLSAWGLMTGSRIDWFFASLSACVCSCVRMCRCLCGCHMNIFVYWNECDFAIIFFYATNQQRVLSEQINRRRHEAHAIWSFPCLLRVNTN